MKSFSLETIPGLLMGTPIGNSAVLAVAWGVAITLVGFLWARALFNRDPTRYPEFSQLWRINRNSDYGPWRG